MGLSRIFGLCAAILFASSVSAANIIDLGPSDYKNWGTGSFHHHANGINAKFGQTVRIPPVNGNLTVTRNPVIPYGSIANGAKNFVRINPASVAASAAITALFLGLDWVFDEELDSWMKEGQGEVSPQSGVWVDNTGTRYDTLPEICEALAIGNWKFSRSEVIGNYPALTGECYGHYSNSPTEQRYTSITMTRQCPAGSSFSYAVQGCVLEGQLIPLSEADWQRLESEMAGFPAPIVGEAAGDIQRKIGSPLPGYTDLQMEGPSSTTGPESVTTTTTESGDSVVTTTTTTTNYSYGDTTITTTSTTTSTTYTNGTHTSTEVTTETPGELPVSDSGGAPPAGEWPGFCEWASIVCEWIGWTQEEPDAEPDLPQVIDDDFYEEKTIQFGSKSCPPDYEINIPFINSVVAVPMQPLCDFAGIIYYMVMAAAYIIAAYITIGVARNG